MIAGAFVLLPIALLGRAKPARWALLGLLALPLASQPVRAVRTRTDGPALNGALAGDRRACSAPTACWSPSAC